MTIIQLRVVVRDDSTAAEFYLNMLRNLLVCTIVKSLQGEMIVK